MISFALINLFALAFGAPLDSGFQYLANTFADCPVVSPRNVTPTLYDIRADEFQLIMVIGDSISAGLRAGMPYDPRYVDKAFRATVTQYEYRGQSYASGVDSGAFSLAQAIRHYNPDLKGVTTGTTPFTLCSGPICPAKPTGSGLNAALSGALTSQNNVLKEWAYLDSIMPQYDPKAWKLMIYELGFNDLCVCCVPFIGSGVTADAYESDLRTTLDQARSRYSNILIILTSPFEMSKMETLIQADPVCPQIRALAGDCPCLNSTMFGGPAKMDELAREFAVRAQNVALDWQSKQLPDFGVVFDRGLSLLETQGTTARDSFSTFDCFHPNTASHSKMGSAIWGNLFLPSDQKLAWTAVGAPPLYCMQDTDRVWYPKM